MNVQENPCVWLMAVFVMLMILPMILGIVAGIDLTP